MPALNEPFPAELSSFEEPIKEAYSGYIHAPVEVTINETTRFIQLRYSEAIATAASYVGPEPNMPRRYITEIDIAGTMYSVAIVYDRLAAYDFPTCAPVFYT